MFGKNEQYCKGQSSPSSHTQSYTHILQVQGQVRGSRYVSVQGKLPDYECCFVRQRPFIRTVTKKSCMFSWVSEDQTWMSVRITWPSFWKVQASRVPVLESLVCGYGVAHGQLLAVAILFCPGKCDHQQCLGHRGLGSKAGSVVLNQRRFCPPGNTRSCLSPSCHSPGMALNTLKNPLPHRITGPQMSTVLRLG